ncbi:MAG: transporter substrate-binding domain-containing protein [Eubacterium sp.]
MKKFLSVLLAAVMTISVISIFAACSKDTNETTNNNSDNDTSAAADSDLAYIKDKGKLVIGVTVYEPMNYKDKETDEWTGFDTEYAEAVCEKLGVDAEFVIIDWDNKFLELDAKTIDCIWNGMTITDEVKLNASVTDAYVKNAQVVVTTADVKANYTTLAEMTDLAFAAEAGSAGAGALDDAGITYTAVSDQASALMEVASGSSDACVIDITMANAMTGAGTSYEDLVQAEELNEEEYGIACRKDSDLTAEINKITDELIADGTLDKLAEKYSLTLIK